MRTAHAYPFKAIAAVNDTLGGLVMNARSRGSCRLRDTGQPARLLPERHLVRPGLGHRTAALGMCCRIDLGMGNHPSRKGRIALQNLFRTSALLKHFGIR